MIDKDVLITLSACADKFPTRPYFINPDLIQRGEQLPRVHRQSQKNLCLIAARAEQPAFYVIKLKAPRGALQISRKHTFTPPRARHRQTKSEAVNKQELLVLTLRTVEARTDGSCHMLI